LNKADINFPKNDFIQKQTKINSLVSTVQSYKILTSCTVSMKLYHRYTPDSVINTCKFLVDVH